MCFSDMCHARDQLQYCLIISTTPKTHIKLYSHVAIRRYNVNDISKWTLYVPQRTRLFQLKGIFHHYQKIITKIQSIFLFLRLPKIHGRQFEFILNGILEPPSVLPGGSLSTKIFIM